MPTNNKKLKIALVSKLWEPTDPYSIGGTGSSVGLLADGLVARGHDVTLFATGDSQTKAKLISYQKKAWHGDYSEPLEYLTIAEAFNAKNSFDIIHTHVEQKACFFAAATKTPTVVNIRYGEFFEHERMVLDNYKNLNYVAISEAITKLLPNLNWKDVVYNGIDYNLFPFNETPENYLLFLARISPQKGPDKAIEVAKKTGKKLIIAGRIAPEDIEYFETKVKPHIDDVQIQFVGTADFKAKIKLFQNASVFLSPINIIEAFGITLIESLACGTPVIAFDLGAPREIIKQGKTGFVVQTVDEMVEAVKQAQTLSRKDCRDSVIEQFGTDVMVEKYLKVYEKIINENQ